MREDGVNRIEAKTTKLFLQKEDLGMFVKLANRRDIRGAVVNKLVRLMVKGENFESPLVANKKNGKYFLIDGNHRLEAITLYLTRYPERKVEVWMFYYDDLTPDEERKYYTKWNSGTKQSTNDFIKQYWATIPIIKKLNSEEFPVKVSHTWTDNAMEFKFLIGPYIQVNAQKWDGNFHRGAMELIENAKKLGDNDVKLLRAFLLDYIHVFGKPDRKNMHYKGPVFYSLMKIWFDNYKRINHQDMIKALTAVRGHRLVVDYSILTGRENVVSFRQQILKQSFNKHQVKFAGEEDRRTE